MSLYQELKRRNVFKVAVAYIIIGWLLLQVSDTLAPALLLPEWIQSAVAFLLILGFPVALVFAWAIELTPDGLKLETPGGSAQHSRPVKGRSKLDIMTLVLLVVALVYFSYDKFTQDSPRQSETDAVENNTESSDGPEPESRAVDFDKSIVVLPFENMSSDEEQEYFSDGISEELLNLLANIPELRVISRTSAFYFKGKNTTIADISRELNVAYVLEGSVRKAGNLVRITAQLIEAHTDTHLWSQTYDREISNLFAVQDEISSAIVTALKNRLGLQVEMAPRTNSVADADAYDAYLRGRHLLTKRTKSSIEGAVREFEKAIELYPDYALAHAELAIANLLLANISGAYGDLTENESLTRALPHAQRAMDLDPNLAEAQAAIGFVRKRQGQLVQAIEHYRRAIEINPSYAEVYTWIGFIYFQDLGDYAEGSKIRERALHLDPLSRPALMNYLGLLLQRDRFDELSSEIDKISLIYPDIYEMWKGNISMARGEVSKRALGYLEAWKTVGSLTRSFRNGLGYSFAYLGLQDEALALFSTPSPYLLSMLGRHEEAVVAAEARFTEEPTSASNLYNLGLALARSGNYSRAGPFLENLWQMSGQQVTLLGTFRFRSAVALIIIRQASNTGIEDILTAAQDHVKRLRLAGFTRMANLHEGYFVYLGGERPRGLELIAEEVKNGRFLRLNSANYKVLQDDPGFKRILEIQQKRAELEQKNFLNVACNDNPYSAFWKPSAGTCDRFSTQ